MIYCLPIEKYSGEFIEEISYKDENDFEWRIARVENGFFVRYFGDPYFLDTTFECELDNGECQSIKNTNCVFFQDASFETFCLMRDILKNGYTDDIQECLTEFFSERFNHNKKILESELIK